VAARHADVLVERRIAVDRRLLRRHDSVGKGVDAGDRHGQHFASAQILRAQLRKVGRRPHRVHDQAIERLDERRRLASGGIHRHGASERDHRADALRGFVGAVQREHAAEAPAQETHLAPAPVVQVADFLVERVGVLAGKADVAPEAPGLDFVAPVLQEELEHDQGRLVRHEARKQQHRVAVPAWRPGKYRQIPGQRGHLEKGTRL